jgi:TetR/AcrR family transcriptional regulator, transcriptional repressor for nem operon
MRKSREKTAESRATILQAASRLLRERGIDATTIADVMEAAGMTQGGFYRHFSSKDDLLVQATRNVFDEVVANFDRQQAKNGASAAWKAYAGDYLAKQHIDHPGSGCPVAGFGGDAARVADVLGSEFAQGAEALISRVSCGLSRARRGPASARAEAIRILTMLVGTVVVARALGDSPLRDEIVRASRGAVAS